MSLSAIKSKVGVAWVMIAAPLAIFELRRQQREDPARGEGADTGALVRRAHALPWLPSVLLPKWERSKRRR